MITFPVFWIKNSLCKNKKLNFLFMAIILIAFILFDTGVIYQDSQDNYYINKNSANTDVLTGQIASESNEVLEYVANSKIRHIEYHLCCQMVGIHERYQALTIQDIGTVSTVFDTLEIDYAELQYGQVILNSDIKNELREFCTFEYIDGLEWIIIEKDGITCKLQIVQEVSFSNPYFLSNNLVALVDENTLEMLCDQYDSPLRGTVFFNLQDLSGDAVEKYFSNIETHFSGKPVHYISIQNRTSIGYDTLLFQSNQNNMVLIMCIISILFALVAMLSGVSLKMRRCQRDIAVLKKVGVNNSKIGFTLSFEIFLLTVIPTILAFFISYSFMWLALDKINFILENGKVGVNIMFSWRLCVKIILSNFIALIILILPILFKLFITSPVSYAYDKNYNNYIPHTSVLYINSTHFSVAFSWLLFLRDKKNNLFQILMTALPLINIILLMMVDMRNIPQETEKLNMYYIAMWDFAILMSWLRSISCLITTGITTLLYYETKHKEINTLRQIGIHYPVIFRSYFIHNLCTLLFGIIIALGTSYLYYLYVIYSTTTYSVQIDLHFPLAGVIAYILTSACIFFVIGKRTVSTYEEQLL